MQPPGYLPSHLNFLKIFLMGMFSRSRNSTVLMKISTFIACPSKSRSNTLVLTFLIFGCKHDTEIDIGVASNSS